MLKAALHGIKGDVLTINDLRRAAIMLARNGGEARVYWDIDPPSDVQLMLSYSRVMTEAGLPVRANSQRELAILEDH